MLGNGVNTRIRKTQSGATALELFALLLLSEPSEFTFHSLLTFVLYAERNQRLLDYSLHPALWFSITLHVCRSPFSYQFSRVPRETTPILDPF